MRINPLTASAWVIGKRWPAARDHHVWTGVPDRQRPLRCAVNLVDEHIANSSNPHLYPTLSPRQHRPVPKRPRPTKIHALRFLGVASLLAAQIQAFLHPPAPVCRRDYRAACAAFLTDISRPQGKPPQDHCRVNHECYNALVRVERESAWAT